MRPDEYEPGHAQYEDPVLRGLVIRAGGCPPTRSGKSRTVTEKAILPAGERRSMLLAGLLKEHPSEATGWC